MKINRLDNYWTKPLPKTKWVFTATLVFLIIRFHQNRARKIITTTQPNATPVNIRRRGRPNDSPRPRCLQSTHYLNKNKTVFWTDLL
ncbi:unnamed protein product [Leptidea sinapis]|uniref:Uncharacterized protein n=1 Tax=Leptidea sinapis TaxID=189913 RepID=A0A5E4PTR2_9NEOP|nr:unnamed protein product [Leptidea sinapis]